MVHDISQPYSESELDALELIFKGLPSYKPSDVGGIIKSCDIPALWEAMDYRRSQEELAQYIAYCDKKSNGIIGMDEFLEFVKSFHDVAEIAKKQAKRFDLDGDGFISSDEYKQMMPIMVMHDPRLKVLLYEGFVAEADANRDGKISVEECAAWINATLKKVSSSS